jgi:hypothetical protein
MGCAGPLPCTRCRVRAARGAAIKRELRALFICADTRLRNRSAQVHGAKRANVQACKLRGTSAATLSARLRASTGSVALAFSLPSRTDYADNDQDDHKQRQFDERGDLDNRIGKHGEPPGHGICPSYTALSPQKRTVAGASPGCDKGVSQTSTTITILLNTG